MRIFLTFLSICWTAFSFSQVIWTEDFSAGSAARGTSAVGYPGSSGGTWSQTITGAEGGSANQWYVSGEECGNAAGNCGSVCSNADASLHVSAIGGLCGTPDCGAAYDETSAANATNKRIESPIISTVGFASLTLDFGYIAAQGDDGFVVEYSCDGGTTWNLLGNPTGDQCCCLLPGFCGAPDPISCTNIFSGQGYWSSQAYVLPACTENIANLRIGFHWTNDGNGIGTDPSVAIDDITITSAAPLPVELVNVSASETRDGNQVSWTTLTETNNSHFEIQHHNGTTEFTTVGTVIGQGTSTASTNYAWMHLNANNGDNYYRLKQVDYDGKFSYSQTLLVRKAVSTERKLLLYPNPAQNEITAQYFSDEDTEGHFMITDLSGRVVMDQPTSLNKGTLSYTIDVQELESGPYLFVVIESGQRSVKHFNKQ